MEQYKEPAINLVIPKHAKLAKVLYYQPENQTDKERHQLRLKVIDLYIALYGKRETVKHKRLQPPAKIKAPLISKPIKLKPELKPKLNLFLLLIGPTQYPSCIKDKRQTKQEQTFLYYQPTKRNNYINNQHLEEIKHTKKHSKLIKYRHPKYRKQEVYL